MKSLSEKWGLVVFAALHVSDFQQRTAVIYVYLNNSCLTLRKRKSKLRLCLFFIFHLWLLIAWCGFALWFIRMWWCLSNKTLKNSIVSPGDWTITHCETFTDCHVATVQYESCITDTFAAFCFFSPVALSLSSINNAACFLHPDKKCVFGGRGAWMNS